MNTLQGLRLLNTRPRLQAHALSEQVRALGGKVIEAPALVIEALPTHAFWDVIPSVDTFSYCIVTSRNAVAPFFTALALRGYAWPAHITVIAIGHATASALHEQGIDTDALPCVTDSEHLIALPCLQAINQKHILLLKGEGGRTLIPDTLRARGADVICLDLYRRLLPPREQTPWERIWRNDEIDLILLTSEEAMHHLFILFGTAAEAWLKNKPCLTLSSRLAQKASQWGLRHVRVCRPDAILPALKQFKYDVIRN